MGTLGEYGRFVEFSVYISKSTLSGRLTDSAYHRLFKNKFKNKDVLSTTDFCIYDFDKKNTAIYCFIDLMI